MKLRDILELLKNIYCGKIGAEFAHISRAARRLWLRKRFEQGAAANTLSDDERLYVLDKLTSAEGIERYLHTRYVGQKRFSLEGGESLIPMLDDDISSRAGRPVSRRSLSAWRIAAASTCSSTSSVNRRRNCSRSSRATTTSTS